MKKESTVLVLGAYGLAGRAIVARLMRETPYRVLAAGRDSAKLHATLGTLESDRACPCVLDALDAPALREVCEASDFVVNAVGPFARSGAVIVRTVLESGKPYLDCANEQQHYRHLEGLAELAVQHGVPLITAAGAIPGVSTLLAAQFPDSTHTECCWAQLRHAYPDSGLASMMGGILESLAEPVTLVSGHFSPVVLGKSVKAFTLPAPFGCKQCLELPTIDALTLPNHVPLQDYHSWFYMGDLPLWLLEVVRFLQPQRRAWAYRLLESVMRRINTKDTAKSIAAGIGPEALLLVTGVRGGGIVSRSMMFVDGAAATACLPVYLARLYLTGGIERAGLLTPLDLIAPDALDSIVSDIRVNPTPESEPDTARDPGV